MNPSAASATATTVSANPNQAPPLAGSEWVIAKGYDRLTHIPLEGLAGQLPVEGKDWNLNMAPMGAAFPTPISPPCSPTSALLGATRPAKSPATR